MELRKYQAWDHSLTCVLNFTLAQDLLVRTQAIVDNLTIWVFTMLEPYLKPLMQTATKQLASSAASVIDKVDQYEVFNDPSASDPTHSMLSKDHFVR
jgi:hypothetical protein